MISKRKLEKVIISLLSKNYNNSTASILNFLFWFLRNHVFFFIYIYSKIWCTTYYISNINEYQSTLSIIMITDGSNCSKFEKSKGFESRTELFSNSNLELFSNYNLFRMWSPICFVYLSRTFCWKKSSDPFLFLCLFIFFFSRHVFIFLSTDH